jgi:hypothetical protein
MAISIPGLRIALQPIKTRIKSATSKSFWLRYCTLAGYRVFCSALIQVTGKTMSGSYTVPVPEAVKHAHDVLPCLSLMNSLPSDVRATAMRVVERARPSLAAEFINATNDDLIAANVVLVARRGL